MQTCHLQNSGACSRVSFYILRQAYILCNQPWIDNEPTLFSFGNVVCLLRENAHPYIQAVKCSSLYIVVAFCRQVQDSRPFSLRVSLNDLFLPKQKQQVGYFTPNLKNKDLVKFCMLYGVRFKWVDKRFGAAVRAGAFAC